MRNPAFLLPPRSTTHVLDPLLRCSSG